MAMKFTAPDGKTFEKKKEYRMYMMRHFYTFEDKVRRRNAPFHLAHTILMFTCDLTALSSQIHLIITKACDKGDVLVSLCLKYH